MHNSSVDPSCCSILLTQQQRETNFLDFATKLAVVRKKNEYVLCYLLYRILYCQLFASVGFYRRDAYFRSTIFARPNDVIDKNSFAPMTSK